MDYKIIDKLEFELTHASSDKDLSELQEKVKNLYVSKEYEIFRPAIRNILDRTGIKMNRMFKMRKGKKKITDYL